MARPLRIAYSGAYYHVTSGGNEQKDVLKSRKDQEKFLDYLMSARAVLRHVWQSDYTAIRSAARHLPWNVDQ